MNIKIATQTLAAVIAILVFSAPQTAFGQDRQQVTDPASEQMRETEPSLRFAEEEAAVRAAIESYVTTFNSKNAEATANHWSENGVYVSKISGNRVEGREAILAALTELFAEETQRQFAVTTDSIQFISPNVALERGTATVIEGDQAAEVTSYRGIYVERDGKWLIDRMTEEELTADESNYEQLSSLEWLIGSWVDQTDDATIRMECTWTRNRNFISRAFRVETDEGVTSSGLQLIGWDPAEQEIRSWLFDSAAGFVKGTWSSDGDRWYVKSVGTMADGTRGSFTSVFRPIDDNSYGWKKVQRTAGAELLPNIDEVVIVRD